MENNSNKANSNKASQASADKNVVDKVASGERASFGDAPLTPPKKMQAEEKRMKGNSSKTEERHEEDRQQANLGSKVLTPQQKADRDRAGAQPAGSSKGATENSSKNKA